MRLHLKVKLFQSQEIKKKKNTSRAFVHKYPIPYPPTPANQASLGTIASVKDWERSKGPNAVLEFPVLACGKVKGGVIFRKRQIWGRMNFREYQV